MNNNLRLGQVFGNLTVIGYNPNVKQVKKSNGGLQWVGKWECLCVCGTRILALTNQLKSGRTTSCGCSHKNKIKIQVGERFSSLLIVERLENTQLGKTNWKCLCDCGNTLTVAGDKLISKRQVSCGCSRRVDKNPKLRKEKQKEFFHKRKETTYTNFKNEFFPIVLNMTLEEFRNVSNPYNDLLKWNCEKGHSFELRRSGLLQNPHCRICHSFKSAPEIEIKNWLLELDPSLELISNSKSLLEDGIELDIFLPKYNFAIEYNGLYWHTKGPKNRHFFKRELCEKKNIICFQINSDEWLLQPDIIKSMLKARLGLATKIPARKTILKENLKWTEVQDFQNRTHLMGKHRSSKHLGLYLEEKLIAVLSYKKKEGGIDITRFSTELNTTVIGGFSKLLKALIDIESPAFIQSWVDMRYGTGHSLLKTGFKLDRITLGWKWTDGTKTYNRLRCRANMDNRKLTQAQQAEEFGWLQIYDAGQALYVKERK